MMRSRNGPKPAAMLREALHRHPAQVDREDLDQHIADHEHRHREADHRQAHHEAVDPGAVLPGRDHAERHRDHDRQNDGRERDRDRRLDALADHLQHRHVGNQRHAEIAMQQLADPGEELHVDRLVRVRARCGCVRAARASRCRRPGSAAGSPGRQPQQQEHEQRHHAHHGNGGEDTTEQISEHQPRLLRCRCESTARCNGKSRGNAN